MDHNTILDMCTIGEVHDDMAYCILNTKMTRNQAEDACVDWGGHLVTISSQTVYDSIRDMQLWSCRK